MADALTAEIDGLERLAGDLGGEPKEALLVSVGRLRALVGSETERCEACGEPATKGPYPPDAVSFCDECDSALANEAADE
jgi:hypothetical protein